MSVNDPDIIIDKEDAEICGCTMIHEDVVK